MTSPTNFLLSVTCFDTYVDVQYNYATFNMLEVPRKDSCKHGSIQKKRSWLRHHATSQKVAGSVPSEVIGFLN
jgi:hypothetical protein